MRLTSIVKFQPIWLIVISFILMVTVDGQQSTAISVDNLNESNSSAISTPKVQTRFFNWLMNGLNGQSPDRLNGFGQLGGLFRPNSGSNSPFSRLGGSLGSQFGSNDGFGIQSGSMGQLPLGPPPPPMGRPPMGRPPMGRPPMGPASGSQSQFGSPSSSGMTSNYPANGQPMGQMGGQGDDMSMDDPDSGDFGGMSDDDNTI